MLLTHGKEHSMITVSASNATETIAIGIEPGEMLLESIQAACREHDIRSGMVVSGIGTLKTCTMHYVTHTNFPPTDRLYTIEKPIEVLSISGLIADGKPHLHMQVSVGEHETYGGHLESGCEVLYLAEVGILKCNGLAITRRPDPERGVVLLRSSE
ncbi:MAG: DUF296 domain-containing protein [Chitinivibrionales bacterium]|nr:DUF296 domain-containing protein [Chitinivibrionales bacterium]